MQGQQSDAEYAEILARSKWRQSRWAPSRIRMVRSKFVSVRRTRRADQAVDTNDRGADQETPLCAAVAHVDGLVLWG